jgi:hypothetical protein
MSRILKIKPLDTGLIDRDGKEIRLSPTEVAKFQDTALKLRGLKSSIYGGTPRVTINADTGEAWLVVEMSLNSSSDEEVKSHIQKKEKKAKQSAKLILEKIQPGNMDQVFLPGGSKKLDDRDEYQAPEYINGVLYYGHDDEIKQLKALEKALKSQDIELDGETMESPGIYATDFLVDTGKIYDKKSEILIFGWDEKKGFSVKLLDDYDNPMKVKVTWSEDVHKSKQNLKLLQHLIYQEERWVKVVCDVFTKHSPNNTKNQIPDSIHVTDIIDDALDYPNGTKKMWEV